MSRLGRPQLRRLPSVLLCALLLANGAGAQGFGPFELGSPLNAGEALTQDGVEFRPLTETPNSPDAPIVGIEAVWTTAPAPAASPIPGVQFGDTPLLGITARFGNSGVMGPAQTPDHAPDIIQLFIAYRLVGDAAILAFELSQDREQALTLGVGLAQVTRILLLTPEAAVEHLGWTMVQDTLRNPAIDDPTR